MSDEKRTELNMIPDGEENLGSDDAETLSGKESRIAEESDFPVPETESEVSSESDGSKETIAEESEDSDDAVVCESEGAENPVNALSDEDSDKESDSARFGSDENPDSGSSSASDEKRKKASNIVWWTVIAVLVVICAMLFYGRAVYHDAYAIKGSSMTVRWVDGGEEHLSLYTEGKVVYIDSEEELKRGSVIIVDDTERENHPLIKRIVGLGGDKLWIEDGYICVLEKGATESYRITEADGAPLNPIENETKEGDLADRTEDDPLVVPEGYVYYVGDNRNNSLDCRFTGPVSVSLVRGTVKGFVPGWYMIILRINGLESSGK